MWAIFNNVWTWVILAGLVAFTGIFRTITRRIPLRRTHIALILLAIGVFGVGGGMGFFDNVASYAAQDSKYAPTDITDVRVTTAFATADTNCSTGEDPSVNYKSYLRCDGETGASTQELGTGIFTVYRVGSRAETCPVTCTSPSFSSETDSSDTTSYKIVDENTKGELKCYVNNGGAASTSSPKGKTVLGFTEGAASATLGLVVDVDREGMQNLQNYSSVPINLDICGFNYVYEYTQVASLP